MGGTGGIANQLEGTGLDGNPPHGTGREANQQPVGGYSVTQAEGTGTPIDRSVVSDWRRDPTEVAEGSVVHTDNRRVREYPVGVAGPSSSDLGPVEELTPCFLATIKGCRLRCMVS